MCFFILVNMYLWVFLLCLAHARAAIYRLDDDQYERMPPLVTLDDYHACLRDPRGLYCTGYAAYVADEPSPLLNMMQEFSEHYTTHYNHTKALHGTCLSRKCTDFYDLEDTSPDLSQVLEACLNRTVAKGYNLKVKVENFTCVSKNDKPLQIHVIDLVVAVIVMSLIILNVVGSLFDVCAPKDVELPGGKLLLCFSMKRNFKSLVAPAGSQSSNFFKSLSGIRAILIILVVVVHSMLPVILASSNPSFVEGMYDMVPLHFMFNGTVGMQTFLFISAMLMVYHLEIYSEKKTISWTMIPGQFLKRWLRLTPSYAIILAVTATWLRYLGSGPAWNEVIVSEAIDCRRDWWTHLLYINNYFDNSKCMPQAWYVATDTQLFLLGIITYVMCQTLGCRKVILSSLLITGMVLPALHTYFQDLDGTLVISPTDVIEVFSKDSNFHELYKRGHTNMCCYVIGMAAGYLVYTMKKNHFDCTKYARWRPLYSCIFPAIVATIVPLKVFYEEGPRVQLVYRVLLAALQKPVFGLMMGTLLVGTMFGMDKFYRRLLEWPGWTVPGRISYSVYLTHVAIIRTLGGMMEEPMRGSYLRVFELCLFMVTVTLLVAAIFWVMVEEPLAQTLRCCWSSNPEREQPKDAVKTDEKRTKL